MTTRVRLGRAALLLAVGWLSACGPAVESAPPVPQSAPPAVLSLPASTKDSAATLEAISAFTARVDADTAPLVMIRDQVDLGAGATGTLTAWRADTVWQRLHLVAGDSSFTTRDTYWLSAGLPVAARLESHRPDQDARIEQVVFRDGVLYRWVDADGRQLSPESQSTKTEVEMLRSRVDRMLQALSAADSTHRKAQK